MGSEWQLSVEAAWEGERRLLDPKVRCDRQAVGALLAFEFHEIGQSGKHWSRDEILNAVTSEPPNEIVPVLDEQQAVELAPGFVLLTYYLELGERRSRRSSLWRTAPGGPVMVFHQGTPVR
ncbi:nuclear transport factor 2 family protein [Nesterenkonia ebinurensis]|uniref:nuclear transport factor 2 family protein n=1 Tax=Nesterenkonia ebinurensis TaxID=2608252 RepID=UPI00123D0667